MATPAQLTGPAWAEGWHPDLKLDYPASLGVHDDDFTPYTINVLAQKVEGALSTANHVSIYGTGYGPFRGFPLDQIPVAAKTGTGQAAKAGV